MVTAKITDSTVKIWDEEAAEEVHSEKYYGKLMDDGRLELSFSEAFHLFERDELEIGDESGEELDREEIFQRFSDIDEEFDQKYTVYSDLRERGYIVKSGFKFGSHFRVYPRGVNPYAEGDKRDRQHTKYLVHAVPENHTMSFQEMSRGARLAQNVRATMLWGVVDTENDVTYYEVERSTL